MNLQTRPGRSWVATTILTCAVALVAQQASATARDVVVTIDPAADVCGLSGGFRAAVSPAVAWDVLTDYDHIPRFVRSMLASRSERRVDGQIRVHQVVSAGTFVFRRRIDVVLAIREVPRRRITFRDVLGKDFENYAGEWRLDANSGGTSVSYSLAAEPKGALARHLCRGALRRSAEQLLRQVRTEMIRRSAMAR